MGGDTIAHSDDYAPIATWGEAHPDFLRRHPRYMPGGRWPAALMNRCDPAQFRVAFTARGRGASPDPVA